jgi:multimeric flavodoxin WrbA
MQILTLVGSPRKGGNTDILTDVILDSARRNGHDTKKIYLYDHRIGPCIDCRACKKGNNFCVIPDGMMALYPLIEAADVLVFGSPVYWCGPTGTMKQVFDRFRPYFVNGLLKGKKAILVAPAKEGPTDADLLLEMFRRSFEWLEMEFLGPVLGTAYDREDIRKDKEAMEKAAELGAAL